MTPDIKLRRQLIATVKIMVIAVIVLAGFVVTGTLFNFRIMQKITPLDITMNPMAAIEYILLGGCFLLITSKKTFQGKDWLVNLLLFINILICVSVLFSWLYGIDIGIDKILTKAEIGTLRINRMSPLTAFCLLLNSIGVLLLKTENIRKIILSQYIALIVGFIGSFLLLGFLFHSFNVIYVYTSAPTAFFAVVCHLFMAFAIFFAYPDKGLVSEFTKTRIGSRTVLIMLPVAIVLPVLFFWLHLNLPFASSIEGITVSIMFFSAFTIVIIYIDLRNINKGVAERMKLEYIVAGNFKELQHLSGLINMSTEAIITCDTDMVINGWNKGAEKIYGYTSEEAIGQNVYHLIDEPYLKPEDYTQKLETLFREGEMKHDLVQHTKSGKLIIVSHSTVVNKDEEGNIVGIISVGKEITALVETEQKLAALNHSLEDKIKEKTEELAGLYDRISDIVIVLDNEWRYTYINNNGLHYNEHYYNINESLVGKNIWEVFPHFINSELEVAYRQAFTNQTSVRKEFYSNKVKLWYEQTLYPSSKGLTVFIRDITQLKNAEEKQKELQTHFEQIVNSAQEGILVRDEKGIIKFANDYLANIYNLKKEDLLGKNIYSLFDEKHQKFIADYYEKLQQCSTVSYETDIVLPDGTSKNISVNSTPFSINNNLNGSLSMISDITEKKQNEISLIKTNKLYDTFSRVTQLLVNLTTRETLFEQACKIIVEFSSNLHLVWIGEHIAEEQIVKNVAAYGEAIHYADNIHITTDDSAYAEGPTGTAIKTNKCYICNDYYADSHTLPWQEKARAYGFFASAIFTINVNGTIWGTLNVYATAKDYFQESEIRLFDKIADVIAIGIEKLEDEAIKAKSNQSLRIAKEEWERTFNSIPDYIAILDNNHNIVRANKAMADLVNQSTHSIVGQKCYTLMHGTDCPVESCPHTALMEDGRWHSATLYEQKLDAHLEVTTSPIFDKEGNILGSVHIARDITDKKKAETKIKQLAEINEYSSAFVGISDIKRHPTYFNQSVRIALDIDSTEDITKLNVKDFHTTASYQNITKVALPAIQAEGIWVGEAEWLSRKGKIIPVIQVIILHKNEKGEPEFTSTTAIDITELKKKEDELRSLTQDLLNAREEERKQIAKELHDELGQNLTAIKLNAVWISHHIDEDKTIIQDKLQLLEKVAGDTVNTSRRLYNNLYPQMLEEVGISGAILWLVNSYKSTTDIDIEYNTNINKENEQLISQSAGLALFRIYQECFTNILRYAKPNLVVIELFIMEHHIAMTIEDDGIGFVINEVDTKVHHGLLGMRERAYALNGKLTIESTVGKGTKTRVEIPLVINN